MYVHSQTHTQTLVMRKTRSSRSELLMGRCSWICRGAKTRVSQQELRVVAGDDNHDVGVCNKYAEAVLLHSAAIK